MSPDETAVLYEVEPIPLDLSTALPPRDTAKDRVRFAACFLLGLVMHATLLWLLERTPSADMPPIEEAIPVEVIIEPPPEPEQPPQPEPEPEPQPEPEKPAQEFFEKPATDAPRASDQDKKGTRTDPVPIEKPTQPKPAPEQPKEAPKAADPWGLQGQLPQFEFEAPAPKSNIMRGNADRTYLTMIYAHIMQKIDMPDRPLQAKDEVVIKFGVDSVGQVFQSAIVQSSGNREVDNIALAAVRRASPLPTPPAGGPVYLNFKFSVR